MRSTLSRIPKLHAPFVPEAGWEQAGTTPLGKQLWTESIPRSRAVPDFEVDCNSCDGDGCKRCRVWARNPMTNQPLYPKNKPEFYTQERLFFVESDGQGSQIKITYTRPTPEEIEAVIHTKQVADMIPQLASALVDKGLDVKEIVARLTAPVAEVKDEAPEPTAPEEAVPFDDSQVTSDDEQVADAGANEEL